MPVMTEGQHAGEFVVSEGNGTISRETVTVLNGRTLELGTAIYGVPKSIRLDNGPEFISRDVDLWAWGNGVTLDFSRPGKPTDNAFVESFNGKIRAECIDQNWFLSLDDARSKCEVYRREYNEERPHSAIGHKAPVEFMKSIGQPSRQMV